MSSYPSCQVNAAKSSVMFPYVQRKVVLRFYICSQNYLCVSYLWVIPMVTSYSNSRNLFWVLCHWCGIHHGPPSMRLFMLTLSHRPGISLTKKIVHSDLYASMIDTLSFEIGLHHQPLIKIFNQMFDIKSSIHIRGIIIEYLGNHQHQWWYPSHLLTVLIIDR